MKATITFEVTKDKTVVTAIGLNGGKEIIDITGTDIEKTFTTILKQLNQRQETNQILDVIDINNWHES